ncbi:MAG TPA: M56 family metallopeptidase [Terracidiphilus sp.]|nr:M56 family metallopeptidase [Terracidiphilus sp.]
MIPPLLEIALRGLLVAAAVWTGLRLTGMRDVRAQKTAWVLVLASAVLMPLLLPLALRWPVLPAGITLALPAHGWPAAANPAPVAMSLAPTSTSSLNPVPVASDRSDSAIASESSAAVPMAAAAPSLATGPRSTIQTPPPPAAEHFAAQEPRSLVLTVQALAWAVYLAVCGVLMLRLIYGLTSAVSLWLDAEPVDFAPAHNLRLRSSHAVSSPVTIGSGIVLPSNYDEWDVEKLRIVLAHERSHIRQGDFYLQLLAGLYASVFWFSPLGWWIQRRLSDLGEAVSDGAALGEAKSRSSYAQILLEFAGMPRPTLIGVAMARASSLSQRIERLLNESSFRQAFSSSRSRALAAVLMVPAALFASTALIRVQAAAGQDAATAPQLATASTAGVSKPEVAQDAAPPSAGCPGSVCSDPVSPTTPVLAGAEAPVASVAPIPPTAVGAMPAPPVASFAPVTAPLPPVRDWGAFPRPGQSSATATAQSGASESQSNSSSGVGESYAYSYDSDGESFALILGPDEQHMNFSGNWSGNIREQIERARRAAHGPFLWFRHDGKSYLVDDPAIVNQIAAMYKPMDELGRQQEELGKQQEELGKQQEELGRKQEEASVPTPDVSKEMAELNEALAKLQAKKGGAVTQDDLSDLQSKIGDLQGRLGDIQGKIGDIQGKLGEEQGKLGEQQGKLGEQQGRLGEEQGRIAREADRKVKSIIDQSLRNGKARPVQ